VASRVPAQAVADQSCRHLLLREGDLAAGRRGHDAAPAGGASARLEQHGGAELGAVGRRVLDALDLDVGEPDGVRGVALDDAASEASAELERQVRAASVSTRCGRQPSSPD
jgi:hypothetical protein